MHKLHNKNEPYGSSRQGYSAVAVEGCGQEPIDEVIIPYPSINTNYIVTLRYVHLRNLKQTKRRRTSQSE